MNENTKSLKLALSAFNPVPERLRKKQRPIGLFGDNVRIINEQMNNWDELNRDDANQGAYKYLIAQSDAQSILPNDEDMIDGLLEDGFEQHIKLESGQAIRPRVNKGVSVVDGEHLVLKGTKYTDAVRRVYDKGNTVLIPLLSSGFWLRIRPSRNLEYLGFDEQRQIQRTRFGRESIGIMFSGRSALDKEDILDFALECLVGCSLIGYTDHDLKELISANDLPAIAHGLAMANFFDGYMHSIPCHYNPSSCHHVEEVLLNIQALWWANANRLTANQKQHMANFLTNNGQKTTIEEVKKYQEEFSQGTVIEADEYTQFVLKTPSAKEYFDETRTWIDYVARQIVQSVGSETPQEEINKRIEKGLKATELREYGAWIKKIISKIPGHTDATVETETQDDVYNGLEELSDQKDLIKGAKEKIIDFIGKTSVTIIGYPVFACPKCRDGKHVDDPEFKDLPVDRIVPMDPFKHFFSLTDRKVQSLLD